MIRQMRELLPKERGAGRFYRELEGLEQDLEDGKGSAKGSGNGS